MSIGTHSSASSWRGGKSLATAAAQSKRVTPHLSVHCKNLKVVLTLLWVISVACSGASIPSAVSAAIWTFSLATEFPVIYQNG